MTRQIQRVVLDDKAISLFILQVSLLLHLSLKPVLYSTDDYIDIVNNELAMLAVSRVKDYKKCLDRLSRLVDSVKDTDSKYCASFAESILIERLAALETYVNFAKCYSAKDVDACKTFNSQMKYRGERASKNVSKIFSK